MTGVCMTLSPQAFELKMTKQVYLLLHVMQVTCHVKVLQVHSLNIHMTDKTV